MKTSLFDYVLPQNLIANSPISPRDHSKLMIIDRKNETITHKHFYDLVDLLDRNDCLVLNNTKVFPARFFGKKETGGKVEILLNKSVDDFTWEALAKPGIKLSTKVLFSGFSAEVIKRDAEIHYLKFNLNKNDLLSKITEVGITPLPPYINPQEKENILRKEYQTVYAKTKGSVAAPTAGFHFTKNLIKKLKSKGVSFEYVTLHVGLGTFSPVKTKNLEDHIMHSEEFTVSKETVKRLRDAKEIGKRIISVGTTSTRVLETLANNGFKNAGSTDIFIYPPYKFKFVDALITNFHLPKSTLLALVSALVSYPNTEKKFKSFDSSLVGQAYKKAIEENYRFYSFGDSSIIL